jgi:hypothetical protein
MWLFYRKHYQAHTFFALDWLIRLGLALRGGRKLAREVIFSTESQRAQGN